MKNVLLTGISKGLGLEIASTLLESGFFVWGISRSLTEPLLALKEKYPNSLFHLTYDIGNVEDIKLKIFKDFIGSNPIHAYINNAAVAYDDIITNMDIKQVKSMFEVNVFSPFIITKFVIRNMLLNNIYGSIVHLSSISVHTGYKGLSTYAASKGALEAFSKNTAREWGQKGIKSNCLVAGFMETAMTTKLSVSQKDRIYNRTAMKQETSISSVAKTISFLLTEGANSITGQNIFVDSGTI
jgi:3-oxoacyl-[acyl-carrier protein] reductase